MKRRRNIAPILSALLLGILFTSRTGLAADTADTNEPPALIRLETLVVGDKTYSNAVVSYQGPDRIAINYLGGIATVKFSELPSEVRDKLGALIPVEPAGGSKTNKLLTSAQSIFDAVKEAAETKTGMGSDNPPVDLKKLQALVAAYLTVAIAVGVAAYLFWCFLLMRICQNAAKPSPGLVWVPVFQYIPMFKAASMSAAWFWLSFLLYALGGGLISGAAASPAMAAMLPIGALAIGLGSIVLGFGSLIWCFKICIACGKTGWLGLLIFVPLGSLILLLVLAFSGGRAAEEADSRPGPPRLRLD